MISDVPSHGPAHVIRLSEDVSCDMARWVVLRRRDKIRLTAREAEVLVALAEWPNTYRHAAELARLVSQPGRYPVDEYSVEQTICALRRKFGEGCAASHGTTLPGLRPHHRRVRAGDETASAWSSIVSGARNDASMRRRPTRRRRRLPRLSATRRYPTSETRPLNCSPFSSPPSQFTGALGHDLLNYQRALPQVPLPRAWRSLTPNAAKWRAAAVRSRCK